MTVAVVGGLLLLATVLPLLVRGPVARWAVARATGSLCGRFEISGGHFGWAAVWQLVFGRPTELTIEDLRIAGPDGKSVLVAAHLEATLEVHLRPFRLIVSSVLLTRGGWRLSLPDNAVGSFDAFRTVPEAGRAACLNPHATRKATRGRGGPAGSVVLRNIELQDIDVDLDFPAWEVELGRANAVGSLAVGGDGPPLQFEVRDIVARAGALRIGRRGEAWTARVPFDAVAITRVGVTPDAPSDLRLEVAGAETGRARLSGHAGFPNIFPLGPNRPPPGVPGIDVDARWTGFGAALSGLDASWRPTGPGAKRLDGDLRATVQGPFSGPAGTLQVEGGERASLPGSRTARPSSRWRSRGSRPAGCSIRRCGRSWVVFCTGTSTPPRTSGRRSPESRPRSPTPICASIGGARPPVRDASSSPLEKRDEVKAPPTRSTPPSPACAWPTRFCGSTICAPTGPASQHGSTPGWRSPRRRASRRSGARRRLGATGRRSRRTAGWRSRRWKTGSRAAR